MAILAFLYILCIFASTLIFWLYTIPAYSRDVTERTPFEQNSIWLVLGLALWPVALMAGFVVLPFVLIAGTMVVLGKIIPPFVQGCADVFGEAFAHREPVKY